MQLYYDFHIHTGLSPCGDNDMSPNNIVNMSLLNGLDAIAVTDHNTCGNVEAVMRAAAGTGLVVVPGLELETAEEVHVVCLFAGLERALEFSAVVESRLPRVRNRAEIFGSQLYFDADDEVTGEHEYLLVTATSIGLSEAVELVAEHDGVLIPAHVDRGSYSVISNLGFIPPELGINNIEISKAMPPEAFFAQHVHVRGYGYIRSSDAHYLGDINERENYLTPQKPTAAAIVELLRRYRIDRSG